MPAISLSHTTLGEEPGAGHRAFVDGHLPGMRELRNPDSEGGKGASRAALLSKRSEA